MPSGVEIERKFLVEHSPEHLEVYTSDHIEQGYLALDRRRCRGENSPVRRRAYLTIKSGGEQARLEEEIEVDDRRFRALWPLTEGRRIQKTRYLIPAAGGLRIELDVYHEDLAGLVTAEVEFESPEAAAAFSPPAWLGREVTDDPRYKNKRLATHGAPS
jgi:adenylate cyclase